MGILIVLLVICGMVGIVVGLGLLSTRFEKSRKEKREKEREKKKVALQERKERAERQRDTLSREMSKIMWENNFVRLPGTEQDQALEGRTDCLLIDAEDFRRVCCELRPRCLLIKFFAEFGNFPPCEKVSMPMTSLVSIESYVYSYPSTLKYLSFREGERVKISGPHGSYGLWINIDWSKTEANYPSA